MQYARSSPHAADHALGVLVPVISGKGGVGKTTVCLALAGLMWQRGIRVGVIDLDPQGGTTLSLGIPRAGKPMLAEVDHRHGFSVRPSGRALALASLGEIRLMIDHLRQQVDVVLADLSPAITDAPHAATLPLAALTVVVARTDAAGLTNVGEAVQLCRETGGQFLVVPNMLTRTALSAQADALLRSTYAPQVSLTSIPLDARAAEAAAAGLPLNRYAPDSRACRALVVLADDLLNRLGVA